MPRYVAQHSYMAKRDGQQYGPWTPGTEIELHEFDAQWVNRDSPGCLNELLEPPAEASVVPDPPADPAVLVATASGVDVVDERGSQGDNTGPAAAAAGGDAVADTGSDEGAADVVPDGTAQVILGWVGDDPDRAQCALDTEKAKDAPRTSLVTALERLAKPVMDRMHRGGLNRAVG